MRAKDWSKMEDQGHLKVAIRDRDGTKPWRKLGSTESKDGRRGGGELTKKNQHSVQMGGP